MAARRAAPTATGSCASRKISRARDSMAGRWIEPAKCRSTIVAASCSRPCADVASKSHERRYRRQLDRGEAARGQRLGGARQQEAVVRERLPRDRRAGVVAAHDRVVGVSLYDQHACPRRGHPDHLRDRPRRIVRVLQDPGRHDRVEGSVLEGQRLGAPGNHLDRRSVLGADGARGRHRRVDQHATAAAQAQPPGHRPQAAAHVEDRAGITQFPIEHRRLGRHVEPRRESPPGLRIERFGSPEDRWPSVRRGAQRVITPDHWRQS